MSRRPTSTAGPLPWLAALLAAYLLVPMGALLAHVDGRTLHQLTSGPVRSALAVSAGAATVSSLVIALGGIPLGYVLARGRSRGLAALGVLVQLPLALPPLASGILLLFLIGPYTPLGRWFGGGLTDSFVGVVLAQTFVAAPFLIVAARSAFGDLSPSIEGVAATLGHRPWARWRRFLLPLAWPGIRAGLLLAWVRAFGEFGATAVVAYHPYTLPVLTWVQFGSTGLGATLPIVLLSLVAAGSFLALSQIAAVRRGRGTAAQEPVAQGPSSRLAAARRAGYGDASAEPPDSPPRRTPASAADGTGTTRHPRGRGTLRRSHDPDARLAFELQRELAGFRLQLAHVCGSRHVVVLGPSGAGKSLLLRMLAGLEPLAGSDHARVRFGARQWSRLAAERRRIGYVPQDYGLFRHLTVWQHLVSGVEASHDAAREWLRRLRLEGLEGRYPDQLSGGQRQRVALGRALAVAPDVLLLDEPFSALDAPVRHELRADVRRLQRETGLATLIVTHDPREAALLAGEVLVLSDGRLLQAGAFADLLRAPRTPDVARLLGARNVLDGIVEAPGLLRCHSLSFPALAARTLPTGARVTWLIAPERVRVSDRHGLPARVLDAFDIGGALEAELAVGDGDLRLIARLDGSVPDLAAGRSCAVEIPPEAVVVVGGDAAAPGPAGAPE